MKESLVCDQVWAGGALGVAEDLEGVGFVGCYVALGWSGGFGVVIVVGFVVVGAVGGDGGGGAGACGIGDLDFHFEDVFFFGCFGCW